MPGRYSHKPRQVEIPDEFPACARCGADEGETVARKVSDPRYWEIHDGTRSGLGWIIHTVQILYSGLCRPCHKAEAIERLLTLPERPERKEGLSQAQDGGK